MKLALPPVDDDVYFIGVGFLLDEGYEYVPAIFGTINIDKISIQMLFEETSLWTRIKFINEKGVQMIPLTRNGHPEKCPSNLRIPFSQTLNIMKKEEYITVQGNMFISN